MKNRVLNMEFAAMECEKRWENYINTDFKTFQMPEFREQFKILAVKLIEAEVDNYHTKKANSEDEQVKILADAKEDFLYFFFFSLQCQKSFVNAQMDIKQKIEEELVTKLKTDFDIKTEFGQMILYAVTKKCRFQVGYAFDPKIDLLWEDVFEHSRKLWESAKSEWEMAIALGEKFDVSRKHYAKAFYSLLRNLSDGSSMIYYPICVTEISNYLNNMKKENNSYLEAVSQMPEFAVVQKLFGISCKKLSFKEIAEENKQTEQEVYGDLKKVIKNFKAKYRREWQS